MKHVGQDIPHDSAVTHVTGESVFIDDMPPVRGELVGVAVPAPYARGRLVGVDVSVALKVPGVRAILTAKDLGERNRFGPVVHDEDLLVETESAYLGHAVALIAAETREAAERAKRAVVVEMEELTPVLTIEGAIEAGAFLGAPRVMERGDVAAGFAVGGEGGVVEGVLQVGGQEHFYLEPQAAIVVPGEQRTFTVLSSTQHPSEVQTLVAEVLGVPLAHVVCTCKRMGGGFGGKETQAAPLAMMAAVLAARTASPVRFVYERDDDMALTGKRHPFRIEYRAAHDGRGRLRAVELGLYSNGGCSTDLSLAVLERAMLHSDNAYHLPAVRIRGRVCRTNLPSNTAFRGFGGPQGVAGIEQVMDHIARALKVDPLEVRRANLYGEPEGGKERISTHYGQIVRNNTLPRLVEELERDCDYAARRREIAAFNAGSTTHLRGMAISLVKFGISFTRRTLNQANALVHLYLDGSALVTTGATEMGQGVHTRIRQIVADELGVTLGRVRVGDTSTDKNNNTSPTAASSGTDLNGAAAVDACARLRGRLAVVAADMLASAAHGLAPEPGHVRFERDVVFDERAPEVRLPFAKVCCRAYELRVSLGERGFYATPGVDFNRETGRGNPFLYFTNGAACSEVLVDRFTGETKVTRVDLLMDAGRPINPGIDRGQIVGGFVQGMGWALTEELVYGRTGALLTHSPDTYKIPAVSDLPERLTLRLLDNPDNTVSLHRSKALGEPPLLLGLSAWLAVKDAVAAVNVGAAVGLGLPATPEKVLMAIS